MGLDLSRMGGGGSSSFSSSNPFAAYSPDSEDDFTPQPFVAPRASPRADDPSQNSRNRPFPERLDVNFFGDINGPSERKEWEGAETVAELGYIPGRVMESPFSLVNTLTGGGGNTPPTLGAHPLARWSPGARKTKGLIDQIADTLGQVPILGDVLTGANELLEESAKVGPALINAGDIDKLRRLQAYPDDAKIRDVDPVFLAGLLNPINALGNIASWDMTVGQFRQEMLNRGITDEEMAAVVSGEKSNLDFGDRPASTNPLLSLGYSAAFDPTNLAFGLGLAGKGVQAAKFVLKPVRTGIGLATKMEKAGLAARVAPDAVTSAQMIARGSAAGATKAGVGTYIQRVLRRPDLLLKPYVKTSIGISAASVALDSTTDWLDDQLPDDAPVAPLIKDLNDFAGALINDHPLSEGMLWNYVAAWHFPVRDFAEGAAKTAHKAVGAARGGEGAIAALGDVLGVGASHGQRRADFLNRYGGERGAQTLVDFIDDQIAFRAMGPTIKDKFRSIDDAALRGKTLHDLTHVVRNRLRDEGKITNQQRIQVFKDWFSEQSGLSVTNQAGKDTGVRQGFDPERAAAHWTNEWIPAQKQWATVAGERAAGVLQTETVLHADAISGIKDAWRAAKQGDGTVPLSVIRETADRFPQLIQTDEWFAKFMVPDAVAPRWDQVRDRLTRRGKEAPTFGETVHELAEVEGTAPTAPKMPRGPLSDDGVTAPTGHREMPEDFARDVVGQAPARASRAERFRQAIEDVEAGREAIDPDTGQPIVALTREHALKSLRQRLAAAADAEPPPSAARPPSAADMESVRTAGDIAQGATPEQAAAYAERDRAAFAELEQTTMFDWSGEQAKVNPQAEFPDFQKWLRENHPGYRIGFSPELAIVLRKAEIEAPQINYQILRMNALSESLRYWGPFSKAWDALHFLTDPVPSSRMRNNAEQAVMNYALPRGATPAQIRAIIGELGADAGKIRIGFKELEFPLFRGWESLFPKHIDDVAQRHLDPKVYARIKDDFGGFTRMVDRSFNRFVQKQHAIANKGGNAGRLANAIEHTYGAYQGTAGAPLRYVKSFYPIFRFLLSPRYWAMNAMESDILSLVKYGTGLGDKKAGLASLVHRTGSSSRDKLLAEAGRVVSVNDASPIVIGRRFAGYVSANFDTMRPESAQRVLDNLPRDGVEFRYLTQRFGPNEGTWSQQLDKMLYDFDTKGVKGSLEEEARKVLTQEDVLTLGPVLQRLYEINDKNFRSVVGVLEGNNSRTNTERVLNSYFLYWPLTYQLKAGKWLYDALTERAFGRKTNFAGAYTYAHLLETHKELVRTDEEYRKMFDDNPDIWFAAQMIFPVMPFDLGVALNRGTRYAGGELGLWGAYEAAKDPLAAAAKMAELGLTYDFGLLQKVVRDFNTQPKPAARRIQPAALYPPQAGATQGITP